MTVSTGFIANALEWFTKNTNTPSTPVSEWRKARNEFLKSEGVGGVVKNGKNSKSFPPWWGITTQFWFADPIKEKDFVDKWR